MSRSIEPEISPCSGLSLSPRMSATIRSGASWPSSRGESSATSPLADQRARDLLVVQRADLFERVRERIVPDVVQQGGARGRACIRRGRSMRSPRAPRTASSVRRARWYVPERVLEARMRGAGIDEEREAELANVAEPLEGRRVDQLEA